MNKITAYARLLRLPGLAALATPPIIAAMTIGVFHFYNLLLLFIIGAFSAIYGFVLNDYSDVKLDSLIEDLKGKPLVSGDIPSKNALLISVFLILFTFLFIAILWLGETIDGYKFIGLVCIFLAGILGSFYNIFGKKVAGSDFFVAISMSLVFLFGALSFGEPSIITWLIFILTFNQTLHMNAVEGGIKDADHDYLIGVKNLALLSGVKVKGGIIHIPNIFKLFGMTIRLFSVLLLFSPFVFFGYDYDIFQIIILAFVSVVVLFFSIKLLVVKDFQRNAIRKYIGIQSFLRYSLVPIMLVSIIGWSYSLFLIIFPIVWYISFAPLIGEKLFKPRM